MSVQSKIKPGPKGHIRRKIAKSEPKPAVLPSAASKWKPYTKAEDDLREELLALTLVDDTLSAPEDSFIGSFEGLVPPIVSSDPTLIWNLLSYELLRRMI
ncbi:hypothetical protein HWV62_22383 [Athelia sp. TMB]|nr:hypothetical protein HWV62_22383 [Athelia sp. TMB]